MQLKKACPLSHSEEAAHAFVIIISSVRAALSRPMHKIYVRSFMRACVVYSMLRPACRGALSG